MEGWEKGRCDMGSWHPAGAGVRWVAVCLVGGAGGIYGSHQNLQDFSL